LFIAYYFRVNTTQGNTLTDNNDTYFAEATKWQLIYNNLNKNN